MKTIDLTGYQYKILFLLHFKSKLCKYVKCRNWFSAY